MRMRLFCAAVTALSLMAGNFSKAIAAEPPVMTMSSSVTLFDGSRSPAAISLGSGIQSELDRFLQTRKPASAKKDWQVSADGKIEFDKKLWTVSKDSDSGEIFVSKKPSHGIAEIKRSVIRNDDQSIRTISEYQVAKDKTENFWFVFFLDQKLAAATTCTDKTKTGLRNCVTAIPSVCKDLPSKKTAQWSLEKSLIPDVDLVEKRALATVVTMRGEDHQMENMIKTGNLVGLKDKMQTTRGRLTTTPVKKEYIKEVASLCSRTF